jgi:hypothetical protein
MASQQDITQVVVQAITKGFKQARKDMQDLNQGVESVGRGARRGGRELDKFGRGVKGAGGISSNTTKNFSKMQQTIDGGGGNTGLVRAYALLAANVFAVTAAFGVLQRAAAVDKLTESMEILSTRGGQDIEVLSNKLKEASGNAIALDMAFRQVSLASSAGLSTAEIEGLTTVAKGAAISLGRDLPDALDRIFRGAIKLEPEILDEIGLFVRVDEAAKKYAQQLGRTVTSLSQADKRQAFLNEILDQGISKFEEYADTVEPDAFTQLAASLTDIALSLTKFFTGVFEPFIKFLAENKVVLGGVFVAIAGSLLNKAIPAIGQFMTGSAAAAEQARMEAQEYIEGVAAKANAGIKEAKREAKERLRIAEDTRKKQEEKMGKTPTFRSQAAGAKENRAKLEDKTLSRAQRQVEIEKRLEILDKAKKRAKDDSLKLIKKEERALKKNLKTLEDIKREEKQIRDLKKEKVSIESLEGSGAARRLQKLQNQETFSGAIANAAGATETGTGGFFGMKDGFKTLNAEFDKMDPKAMKLEGTMGKLTMGFQKAKGGLAVLAGGFQNMMMVMGPYIMLAGVVLTVLTALFKVFATGQKESKKLTSSLENLSQITEKIGERQEKQLSIMNDQTKTFQEQQSATLALITSNNELANSTLETIKRFEDFQKASNGLQNTWQGFLSIFGSSQQQKTFDEVNIAVDELLQSLSRQGDDLMLNKLMDEGTMKLKLNIKANERLIEVQQMRKESTREIAEATTGYNEATVQSIVNNGNLAQKIALVGNVAFNDMTLKQKLAASSMIFFGDQAENTSKDIAEGLNISTEEATELFAEMAIITDVQSKRLKSFQSAVKGAEDSVGKFQQSFLPRTKADEILGSLEAITASFEALMEPINETREMIGKEFTAEMDHAFDPAKVSEFLKRFDEEDNPIRKIFSPQQLKLIQSFDATTKEGQEAALEVIKNVTTQYSIYQMNILSAKQEQKLLNEEQKLFNTLQKQGGIAGEQIALRKLANIRLERNMIKDNNEMLLDTVSLSRVQQEEAVRLLNTATDHNDVLAITEKFGITSSQLYALQGSHYEVINSEAKALLAEETLLLDVRELNLNSLLTQIKAAEKLNKAIQEGKELDAKIATTAKDLPAFKSAQLTIEAAEKEAELKQISFTIQSQLQQVQLQIAEKEAQSLAKREFMLEKEMAIQERAEKMRLIEEGQDRIAADPSLAVDKYGNQSELQRNIGDMLKNQIPELDEIINKEFTPAMADATTQGLIDGLRSNLGVLADAFEQQGENAAKAFVVAVKETILGAEGTGLGGVRTIAAAMKTEETAKKRIDELEAKRPSDLTEKDKLELETLREKVKLLGKLNTTYMQLTTTAMNYASVLKGLGPDGEFAAAVIEGTVGITNAFMSMREQLDGLPDAAAQAAAGFTDQDMAQAKMAIGAEFAANALQQIGAMMAANSKHQVAEIDRQIEAEKKRDGKSKESVAKIAAMEKKKEAMQRKAFNQQKKVQMAATIASTAAAIVASVNPVIGLGPVAGIPLAAMHAAMGALQLAVIARQKFEGGSGDVPKAQMQTLNIGKRSSNVDVTQRATAGELNYLRGGRTTGQDLGGAGGAMGRRGYGMGKRGYAMGDEGIVVGERGPEIITPAAPIDITPNFALGGGETNVNFSINAIDAAGVEDVLMNQQGNIIRMIREAANENGERFLETVDTQTYGSNT